MRIGALAAVIVLTLTGCDSTATEDQAESESHGQRDPRVPRALRHERPMPVGVITADSDQEPSGPYADSALVESMIEQRAHARYWFIDRSYKVWNLCGYDLDAPAGQIAISVPRGKATYYVRITARATSQPLAEVIVSPGRTTHVRVPICPSGRNGYTLRYAAGTKWYGYRYLFGPKGAYSEADEVFDFVDGTEWAVSLSLRQGGNLPTSGVGYSQFIR